MIQFRLSNRQRNELLVRARPLAIALPAPLEVDDIADDPVRWCRRALGSDGRYIVRAELVDLLVRPSLGTNSLAGLLGAVVDGEPEPETLCWWVSAFVCDLDPPDEPRGERMRVQWPLRCHEPATGMWFGGAVQGVTESKS